MDGIAITVPLRPEGIVDFAWGLSLYFSHDEQEKKFGEDIKNKWDALALKYKDDQLASRYLDNVNAAMAGTIYNLAQLRQQVADQFAFLDILKNRRITDLDDLANLSKDAQSVGARLVGLSMGGGATFLQFASSVLGAREIVYIVFGAGVAYVISEIILRLFKNLNAPRILKQTQMEKDSILKKQFQPKANQLLSDLLKKINEISKEIYETKFVFVFEPKKLEALSLLSSKIHSSSFVTGSNAQLM